MPYELKTEKYSGPLEKLLELIEERKLQITEISLAEVTDDFLRYLESLKSSRAAGPPTREELRFLADFIVVASRLLFIKSKSLLPDLTWSAEEEAEIKDLEARLEFYREFRPAMKYLAGLWSGGSKSAARPYFLSAAHWIIPHPPAGGTYSLEANSATVKFFFPGRNSTGPNLTEAMERLFEGLRALTRESEVIQEKIITLEEKIAEIIGRVQAMQTASFRSLSAAESRGEMIVTFLAILHLAREQLIYLEQTEHLSDIIITKREAQNVKREA